MSHFIFIFGRRDGQAENQRKVYMNQIRVLCLSAWIGIIKVCGFDVGRIANPTYLHKINVS